MKDQTNARHHYLPLFYLEYFAERERLVTQQRSTGERRFGRARNMAVETGFYTLENSDGTYSDEFEKELSTLEGHTRPVLDRLNSRMCFLPYGSDRRWLALFLAVQARRTPEARIQDMALKDVILEEQIGLYLLHGGSTDLPREYRPLVANALREAMAPTTKDHMVGIVSSAQMLSGLLMNRRWTIMRFRTNSLLATCDCPVIALDADGNRCGLGFGVAKWIIFPLGPLRLLIAERHGPTIFPDRSLTGSEVSQIT
jgi:Protein of unknown function (DUF4238)